MVTLLNKSLQAKYILLVAFFSLFVLIWSFAFSPHIASAASVNSPVCSIFSNNPLSLTALDVGSTTYVQFYGADTSPNANSVKITFQDTGGPGTSVVGLPANYQSLSGQTTLLKNFAFTGITAGSMREIQVDFQVLNSSGLPECWNRKNYQVTVTNPPPPDYQLVISPISQNVVQGNTVTYSIYVDCNRSFARTNTISNFNFLPGALSNVTATFNTANVACGTYVLLSLATSLQSTPASTPNSPLTQGFTVSSRAVAYNLTRTTTANLTIYGLPQVDLNASPNTIFDKFSGLTPQITNLTWTSQYLDYSRNGNKPCVLEQNGSVLGDRAGTLNAPGEAAGPFDGSLNNPVIFEITCYGFASTPTSSMAFVNISPNPDRINILWTLNGEIQGGSIPNISYTIKRRFIGGGNCTAFRRYCELTTLSSAPASYNPTNPTGYQYTLTMNSNDSLYTFTGITEPGEQLTQVALPYSSSEIPIAPLSTDRITYILHFIDSNMCPNYNDPPYNTSDFYIQIPSSTSLPPALFTNINIGDAMHMYSDRHFTGGTFRRWPDFSNGWLIGSGKYEVVNGTLLRPLTYVSGQENRIAGASADWIFTDDNGKKAYNCGMRDTSFWINDFGFASSTASQTKMQGQVAVYSMAVVSKKYFNHNIQFYLDPAYTTLPSNASVTYCDNLGNCASDLKIKPGMGATVNGYVRIGTDNLAGNYTFRVCARYVGNYSNRDVCDTDGLGNPKILGLTVNVPTPPPIANITSPVNNSTIVYGTSQSIVWNSVSAIQQTCVLKRFNTDWSNQINLQTIVSTGSPNHNLNGTYIDGNIQRDYYYRLTCTNTSGIGNSLDILVNAVPGAPTNVKAFNSSTDPVNHPVPCGQIKLTWQTGSGAQGYYIYTTPAGASIQTVNNGSATQAFVTTNNSFDYYLASYANYGSGVRTSVRELGSPSPIAPIPFPCPPKFTSSDIDIISIDGASVSNPVYCDGIPSAVLSDKPGVRREYVSGSVIKYSYNLCNDGFVDALLVKPELILSNLTQPSTGYKFHLECSSCGMLNNLPLIPTGQGTKASPFVFDLSLIPIASGKSIRIVFEAETQIPINSSQSDFYAYSSGTIKGLNFQNKTLTSSFVHFRVGSPPDLKEVTF